MADYNLQHYLSSALRAQRRLSGEKVTPGRPVRAVPLAARADESLCPLPLNRPQHERLFELRPPLAGVPRKLYVNLHCQNDLTRQGNTPSAKRVRVNENGVAGRPALAPDLRNSFTVCPPDNLSSYQATQIDSHHVGKQKALIQLPPLPEIPVRTEPGRPNQRVSL